MNHDDPLPAAGAAPTATTVPAAPDRRRRGLRIALLVFIVAVTGAVAWLLLRESSTSTEFRKETEALFTMLNEGQAEKVYDDASFRFKQTLLVDKFVDMADRMKQTLGPFVRVIEVIEVDRAATVAGMTARVQLELEFEKADTVGEVSFHRGARGTWKLLGLNVEIPREFEDEAAAAERDYERLRAPDEVIEMFNQTLDSVREGKAADIHRRASPSFQQSRSVESFQSLLDSHRNEMGNFERVLAVISSAQNADKDRARVHALLQYQKAKTTGTFEFMRVQSEWRLYGFKVVVPEPFLPREPAPETPFAPDTPASP